MSDDKLIEDMIEAAGKGHAPRITMQRIDALMAAAKVQYHVFPGTTSTVALVTLPNGFSLIGHSAAASPENFDRRIGEEIAFRNARQQLWGLEGYMLRQRLHEMEKHRYGATQTALEPVPAAPAVPAVPETPADPLGR